MRILILLFIGIIVSQVHAQVAEKSIKDINLQVEEINKNLDNYQVHRTHQGYQELDSGYREIFTNRKGDVVLITLNQFSPEMTYLVKYYFSKGAFIYGSLEKALRNGGSYTEQFYIEKDRLIEWLGSDGKSKDKTEDDYKISDQDLANYAYSLVDDFKNQSK